MFQPSQRHPENITERSQASRENATLLQGAQPVKTSGSRSRISPTVGGGGRHL